MTSMNKNKISEILLVLCILDILVFPYIRALSCSLSMIIVMVWYLMNFKSVTLRKEMLFIVPLIVVSALSGFLIYDSKHGLSTTVLVIYSLFLFHFVFLCYNEALKEFLSKVLFIYITIVFVFGIIYTVSAQTYFSIRSFWTLHDNEINFTSYLINRFVFIYSDPNNAACALSAIYGYIMICEKHTIWEYVYCIASVSISVILTMSIQGVISFLLISILIFALVGDQYTMVKKVLSRVLIIYLVLILFAGSIMVSNSFILQRVLARLLSGNFSSMGGRLSFWRDTIISALSWENIFIGKGAVIDSIGREYLPHSGNLYLTISYGLVVNVAYIKTMFVLPRGTRCKYYIILLPLMIIYTINTGVSDYRFITLMAVVSAIVQKEASYDYKRIEDLAAKLPH